MLHNKITAMALTVFTLLNSPVFADTTLVAVASNFTKPMTEIAAEFEKATGHTAKLSFSSSGKFVSQIENGAPFEVFLSADESSPLRLEKDGFAVSGSTRTYAIGKLVLWSSIPGFIDDQGAALTNGKFEHIALADPKLAPYGAATVDYLNRKKLLDKLQPLMIMGENISQTHQIISSGNVELGFVALSQVIENGKISSGSGVIIPNNQHNPIKQSITLLKIGAENPAAQALINYLKLPAAKNIIQKYGYDLPIE
ncbi:MAG: hypothetical protein RL755_415 [Pseudomonadota bacterium]|jgi:molybdate transport system substrate-binding protein